MAVAADEPMATASHPSDPPSDIAWSANLNGWSDVVAAFNHGREQENVLLGTSLPPLVFPVAASWAAMSNGEKTLWLINAERTAAGLAPLQGQEKDVAAVAQGYADLALGARCLCPQRRWAFALGSHGRQLHDCQLP